MSTLWTPSGEHQPDDDGPAAPAPGAAAPPGTGAQGAAADDPALAEAEEQLRAVREELIRTPVVDIIANHVVGLWQLAVLHLDLEGSGVRNLDAARVAVDAVAALVRGLGEDLGQHQAPLEDALAQLQTAYVEIAGAGPGVSEDDA